MDVGNRRNGHPDGKFYHKPSVLTSLCVSNCECIDKLSFVLSNSLVYYLSSFLMKVTICL
jgi:hypothetical protein